MKQEFAKLIKVKSIMTLTFSFAFIVFVALGICKGATFEELLKMIVIFYFGTQVQKATDKT